MFKRLSGIVAAIASHRTFAALALIASLGLSACADPYVKEVRGEITGHVVQFTDTGVDRAGGPRVKAINVFGPDGKLIAQSSGSGNGLAQDIATTLLPAAAHATGWGVAASVVRTATTRIQNNTSSFGYGEGGRGGDATANGPGSSQNYNSALGLGGNSYSSAGATSFGGNSGLSAQFSK